MCKTNLRAFVCASTRATYFQTYQTAVAALRDMAAIIEESKYEIIAYVDEQHGLGSMLRTYYQAKKHYQPEHKRWRTLSAKVGK